MGKLLVSGGENVSSSEREGWRETVTSYALEADLCMRGFVNHINSAVDRCMAKASENYENKLSYIKNTFPGEVINLSFYVCFSS